MNPAPLKDIYMVIADCQPNQVTLLTTQKVTFESELNGAEVTLAPRGQVKATATTAELVGVTRVTIQECCEPTTIVQWTFDEPIASASVVSGVLILSTGAI